MILELSSGAIGPVASCSAQIDVLMPATDAAMARQTARTLLSRAGCDARIIVVHDDAKIGFIAICNALMQNTASPYVAYVAQDAFPGRRWLELAHHVLASGNQGLFAFNDGKWFGQLAAFGLVRRSWVQSVYGDLLFYPEYRSHYADTELSVIAQAQGQLAFNANALLLEVDHCKDGKPAHPADKALFAQRKAQGFDGRVQDAALLAKFS
jgi:hypothetical protein